MDSTNNKVEGASEIKRGRDIGKKPAESLATLLVHAGEKPDPITGAVAPVLVRSKTYRQPQFGVEAEYQYSRGKNPTRAILEEKLAVLERVSTADNLPLPGEKHSEGEEIFAAVFASGNAAVATLLLTLKPGDHIIFCKEVYGGTYRLVEQVFRKFGITASYADFSIEDEVKNLINKNTKYLFVETISNPSLHVVDLNLVKKISEETGVPFIVDATFSPPCSLRSFAYGAETIVHSLSKYCAGHNDVLAGAIVTRNKALYEQLKFLQRTAGAILSPDECYRVIQGLKTLEMRWKRVSETAQAVAEYLENHPKVKKVLYPGLPGHAGYEISKRQFIGGCGGVVSFELKTDDLVEVKKFVEGAEKSGVIIYGESLASPESILAYPAWMSHRALPKEERLALGISDSFFRFSVGFEDVGDIIASLEDGLNSFTSID